MRFGKPSYRRPRIRTYQNPPITPAPGMNLKAPEDLSVEDYFKQLGYGCEEYADKFETVDEVLGSKKWDFKKIGVPPAERRHIMWVTELLRRGVMSFEVLSRRTAVMQPDHK